MSTGSGRGYHPRPMPSENPLPEQMLSKTDDLITIIDEAGCIQGLNQAALKFFGSEADQLVGHSVFHVIVEEDHVQARTAFAPGERKAQEKTFAWVCRMTSGDGSLHSFQCTTTRHTLEAGGIQFLNSAQLLKADPKGSLARPVDVEEPIVGLDSVMNNSLDGMVIVTLNGTILRASKSMESLFGWTPEELSGQNIKIIVPEPHRSNHDDYLAKYAETGETLVLGQLREFEVQTKRGKSLFIEMAVTRIEMEGSQSDLLCGIIRDASERKQAELTLKQSEHRFRAIFEQEHQLVVLIDRNGLVREANHAALWIVGDEREGLVGKLLWEAPWWARDLRQRDQIRGWIEAAADGALIQDELELMTLDGDLRTVDFSMKAVQVTSNGPTVFLAEMRDVTETRRAQAREVSMLRALASIGESASILVHEIKNPITSVNLALKAVATLLGEDERAALDDLLLRLRKLERTMQRTLSFARPLELRRRPVSVQELLEGAREQLLPEAEDKQVSIEVNVPKECPPILVDAGQMEEMLVNLLRNSLDVLEEGGQVLLTCEIHEGQVDLLVDDNGPGVPDSVRSTIFDPFVTTKEEGTGVGLALCKKVVEAHEGELTLEKSPLGGARFRICMAAGLRQDA